MGKAELLRNREERTRHGTGVRRPGSHPLGSVRSVAERRVLDSTELFASLPEEMVEQLRSQARVRNLAKGDLLFAQGDESSDMYVVQDGRIAISTRSSD